MSTLKPASKDFAVPDEVREICAELVKTGFEAYLVGGCVRDIVLGCAPKDWDVATNAKPEEIQELFPDSVYENDFGTVLVKTEREGDLETPGSRLRGDGKKSIEGIRTVEVTTYRIEGKYSDKRHPDEVKFAKTIEEDLSRRDFTVNALAMDMKGSVIDPFDGQGRPGKKDHPHGRKSGRAFRRGRAPLDARGAVRGGIGF